MLYWTKVYNGIQTAAWQEYIIVMATFNIFLAFNYPFAKSAFPVFL